MDPIQILEILILALVLAELVVLLFHIFKMGVYERSIEAHILKMEEYMTKMDIHIDALDRHVIKLDELLKKSKK